MENGSGQSAATNLMWRTMATSPTMDVIPPTSARRISIAMAAVAVILMAPLAGLFSQISGRPDFCEVACSPTSALCTEMERRGYVTKHYNHKNGYALERPIGTKMFNQDVKMHPPRTMWVLLPCTHSPHIIGQFDRAKSTGVGPF